MTNKTNIKRKRDKLNDLVKQQYKVQLAWLTPYKKTKHKQVHPKKAAGQEKDPGAHNHDHNQKRALHRVPAAFL